MARRDVVVVGASAGGVEDLWGLRSDEALGQSLFALDIGLPVDPLRPLVSNVLGGDDKSEVTVEAISRLGRSITVHILCSPMHSDGDASAGAILVMDELSAS